MKTAKRITGDWGEEQAALFLINKGYQIVERNYAIKQGEVDIIAWHEKRNINTLCFVEVKTRHKKDSGGAERATGYKKLTRVLFAAKEYCLSHGIKFDRTPIQFEQVSVYFSTPFAPPTIHLYIIPVD